MDEAVTGHLDSITNNNERHLRCIHHRYRRVNRDLCYHHNSSSSHSHSHHLADLIII